MFTFETTDEKEVRRFRIAQFNGKTATVNSGGLSVTGHVRSVRQTEAGAATRWSITLLPTSPNGNVGGSSRPNTASFAEDCH
jgi:hypothetical protein